MIPPEKRPIVMTDVPGFPIEKAQLLIEKTPELRKVLLVQEEPDKDRLVFILDKPTISIDLLNHLEEIGQATSCLWTFIAQDAVKGFISRYKEFTCLFSREPGYASSK